MSIAVIYGSSREDGNTEALAEVTLEGVPHEKIILREKNIFPIHDQRHTEGGFDPVNDDYDAVISEVLKHDTLVFVTPVYWYTVSGLLKNFIDRWSQSLRDPRYDFKALLSQKKAYILVAGGDDPRVKALPLIQQLKYTFQFVGMELAGYVIGKASKPGDMKYDSKAIMEAKWLNQQFKNLV